MKYKLPIFPFACLIFFTMVSLALAWFAYSFGGVDFNVYYAAGRVLLAGGNPYDYQQLSAQIVSVTGINNPYYYAPWFTWGILPLALLPYSIARGLWAVLNFTLWMLSLLNLYKIMPWPSVSWQRWGMYLIATLLFAWTTWGFEQVGILIFFLLTLSLLALQKERWLEAGIWMALLLFKPNITALPIAAILLWHIRKHNWKPALFAAGFTLLLLAISFIITPDWLQALMTPEKLTGLSYKFSESGGLELVRHNTTLKDWLALYNVTGLPFMLIYLAIGVACIVALARTIYLSESGVKVTAVALLVTYIITPYVLYYDYPALTLTFFFANQTCLQRPMSKWIRRGLNGLILLSLFVGTSISYRYWTTLAIAGLMLFSEYSSRMERATTPGPT